MLRTSWMVLFVVSMLYGAASSADDAGSPDGRNDTPDALTLSLKSLLAEPGYATRWHLHHPVEPMPYSHDWNRPMDNFEFEDGGALGRLSKLRNLSLLTLADNGKARLFFGVNSDGLLGLHFRAAPRRGEFRYLEVVRLPYLAQDKPEPDLVLLPAWNRSLSAR